MTHQPEIKHDLMYTLLREGKIDEFNRRKAQNESFDLTECDLRGLDLRGLDTEGVDFSGCYFRQTDLRGINFTNSCMLGASINGSKISGCFFPPQLSAEEITLSLVHGTRMRYTS